MASELLDTRGSRLRWLRSTARPNESGTPRRARAGRCGGREPNAQLLKHVAQCLVQEGNAREALLAIDGAAKQSSDPEVRNMLESLRGYA
jgi:hypothetical protein